MSENEKTRPENEPASDTEKKPLREQELENVSGGFTLFDTCQNQWVQIICAEAPWGICPHLQKKVTGQTFDNQTNQTRYLLSCDKGCFKDVVFTTASEDRIQHRT